MTTYTYEEVFEECIRYFDGDELASKIVIDKYLLRDKDNNLLENSPEKLHKRLVKNIVRIEKNKFKDPLTEQKIFDCLDGFKRIIPAGSVLYGVGNKTYSTLANCYVIEPPLDSYSSILNTDQWIVNICKRRGGIGTDISNLRPAGLPVNNSAGSTSGIIPFLKRYSNTICEVGIHGRRAAGLICLDVRHPQILDFIKSKVDNNNITGVNISIKVSNEFIECVKRNKEFELKWPVDSEIPEVSQIIKARDIWDEIIKSSHSCGCPGLIFIDNVHEMSPPDQYEDFKSVSPNPCGEQFLNSGDSCRLLSINTLSYVNNKYTKEAEFNYEKFYKDCKLAQRIQDDIIDLELEKIDRIIKKIKSDPEPDYIKQTELKMWETVKNNCVNGRRTGTGLTGIADTLAALNLKYDSNKALKTVESIYQNLKWACYESSIEMAEELGPFPIFNFNTEKDCPYLLLLKEERSDLYNRMKKSGRRNIGLTTTAPNGSLSLICQTTSGIEPVYKLVHIRRKKGNPSDENFRVDFVGEDGETYQEFEVFHHELEEWMNITGNDKIEESPWFGCEAHDIDPIKRVKLQGIVTKHLCNAVSSTCNLPNSATQEDIHNVFMEAYKNKTKGITIFRDGCKAGILTNKKTNKNKKRPKALPCDVYHITVSGQRYFVLVGLMNGEPYEVFAGKNGHLDRRIKTGFIVKKKKTCYKAEFPEFDDELSPITACCNEQEEMITRLTSLALQSGASIHKVVVQLEKVGERNDDINCYSRSIARALKKYIPENTAEEDLCPKCNGKLERIGGCPTCRNPQCGWSRCL